MPEFPESQHALASTCERCPALAESRECISWGNGALDAAIVVVGEAPGYGNPDADRWQGGNWTGLAYTSRHSGRRVRALFEELDYDADNLYFTNAVKCFPSDGEGSNREPTSEELANCFTHLEDELRTVDPDVVVTTGKHATKTILDHEGVTLDGFVDSVLEPVTCNLLDTTIVPILHPSYQDVWLSRLGYDRDEYVAAISNALAEYA